MYGRCEGTGIEYGAGCGEASACGEGRGGFYARMIARWAKVELLREKVKQRIDAKYGKKLDKIADLIVEVVVEEAKNATEAERKEAELEDSFENLSADEN